MDGTSKPKERHSMTTSIVVVGSLNMDLVIRSPRIPRPGETVIGGEFHTVPGGKGANQAVAAARLGAKVSMVGRVGKDAFGDALLENLVIINVNDFPTTAHGIFGLTLFEARGYKI
jgi:sugar/nucleoside kinase (ribokinase family)